jgi:hypothetical protein
MVLAIVIAGVEMSQLGDMQHDQVSRRNFGGQPSQAAHHRPELRLAQRQPAACRGAGITRLQRTTVELLSRLLYPDAGVFDAELAGSVSKLASCANPEPFGDSLALAHCLPTWCAKQPEGYLLLDMFA